MIKQRITKEEYNSIKRFKDLEDLQNYYRKNTSTDYFILNDNLYYMEEYDIKGEYIIYTSLEEDTNIYFNTLNRYKNKTDLEVVKYYGIMSLRNDLTHYYYNNISNNLINMFN